MCLESILALLASIEPLTTASLKLWFEIEKVKNPNPILGTAFGTILTVGIVFGIPANFICCYFFATQKSSSENGIYFKRIYILISTLDLAICILLFPVIQAFLMGRQSDSLLFRDSNFCHVWYSLWAVSQQMVIFMVAMLSVSRLVFLKYPHIQAKPSTAWIFPGMVAGAIATILIVFPLASGKATISYRPAYSSCQVQGTPLSLKDIKTEFGPIPIWKLFKSSTSSCEDEEVAFTSQKVSKSKLADDAVSGDYNAPKLSFLTTTAPEEFLHSKLTDVTFNHEKVSSTAVAELKTPHEVFNAQFTKVTVPQESSSFTTDSSGKSFSTTSAGLAPLIANQSQAERIYHLSTGVGEYIDDTLLNQRSVVLLRTSLIGLPVLPIFISFILCWFLLKRAETEAKRTNATVMKHGQASSTVLIVTLVYIIFNIPALMYSIYLVYDYTQNISFVKDFFEELSAVLVAGHEFAPEGSDLKEIFQTGAEKLPDLDRLILESFDQMAFWLSDMAERLKYERKYAAVSFVVLPVLYSCLYPAVVFWRLQTFREFIKNGLKHPAKALPQSRYKSI